MTPSGEKIARTAGGVGYPSLSREQRPKASSIGSDRSPVHGLGHELPAAMTDPTPANLTLKLEKSEKKESGYEFRFRWTWNVKNSMQRVPETMTADVPNFIDLRVIGMEVDKTDKNTGTFLVTSTKNTFARRVRHPDHWATDGGWRRPMDVVSPIMTFTVPALDPEEKPANASASAAR